MKKFNRHKYSAISVEFDGIKFASKKEGRYYNELKLRVKAGEVIFFLRQTSFHLPGGTTYRVDFQEFHADGTVHFVEIKGYETKDWIMKKKLVEALYPIKIEVVK